MNMFYCWRQKLVDNSKKWYITWRMNSFEANYRKYKHINFSGYEWVYYDEEKKIHVLAKRCGHGFLKIKVTDKDLHDGTAKLLAAKGISR